MGRDTPAAPNDGPTAAGAREYLRFARDLRRVESGTGDVGFSTVEVLDVEHPQFVL